MTIGEEWWTSGTSYEGYIVYSYDDAVNKGLIVTDVTTLGAGTAGTAGQPNTGTPGLVLSQIHFSYDEMARLSSVRDYLTGSSSVSTLKDLRHRLHVRRN